MLQFPINFGGPYKGSIMATYAMHSAMFLKGKLENVLKTIYYALITLANEISTCLQSYSLFIMYLAYLLLCM